MPGKEWRESVDPDVMLQFVIRRRASNRKLRLFSCACFRHVPQWLSVEKVRVAVEATERYADGEASKAELTKALNPPGGLRWGWHNVAPTPKRVETVRRAAVQLASDGRAERSYQSSLLHDIFHPFARPVVLAPWLGWNSGAPLALGEAAYQEQLLPSGHLDLGRLAILADSLEDAGCTDAELLGHLRSPGPHVRGCFALDAILGRS